MSSPAPREAPLGETIELVADLNAQDNDGFGWSLLSGARDPAAVKVGSMLVAGNPRRLPSCEWWRSTRTAELSLQKRSRDEGQARGVRRTSWRLCSTISEPSGSTVDGNRANRETSVPPTS